MAHYFVLDLAQEPGKLEKLNEANSSTQLVVAVMIDQPIFLLWAARKFSNSLFRPMLVKKLLVFLVFVNEGKITIVSIT